MATYRATVDTPRGREDAFAYLSDFANTAEWDPGVVDAERIGQAPVGIDSEFRVVAEFLGRRTELIYRTVEYDPPQAVTFLGENATATSRDRVTFEPIEGGTRVTYEAELTLKGALGLADPLLWLIFRTVGDRARAGLRRELGPMPRAERLLELEGHGLDGRSYVLPRDLTMAHSILLVAFRREQQALVDGWLPWATATEDQHPDLAVYELPVIPSMYGPARRLIDGGMVRGIPDPAARARTITVYTDVQRVLESLGLAGTETIAVAVVAAGGQILRLETGRFEQVKADRLTAAINREDPVASAGAT